MITGSDKSAIQKALQVCIAASQGDFEARILNISEKGDMGELMHAINLLIDRSDAYIRESKACLDYVCRNQYYRLIAENGMTGAFADAAQTINTATYKIKQETERFEEIASDFEDKMKTVVESVSTATHDLQSVTDNVDKSSNAANDQSLAAAAGAEQAATNMNGVASATEQLTNAIGEINRQVVQSAEIATQAVGKAENMNDQVLSLAGTSEKISEVVRLINDIAGQTNLLALNATIESARAGEAGKGFAVVASEVKALAAQTEKATDEIVAQVNGIQNATDQAVTANGEISETIIQIQQNSTSIASAVEEQSAATREIARNVEQAALGTEDVSKNIANVQKCTEESKAAATQVHSSAEQLTRQKDILEGLRTDMTAFIAELKKTG